MSVAPPPLRELVLLGGGHSHVEVLRAFGRTPLPGVRITVVSRGLKTPYSGMLPGHVAGCYSRAAIHIDLLSLARDAGARLIQDEVIGLDPAARAVSLRDHPPLRYDRLSVNTGAVPLQTVRYGTPVKPIDQFLPRWDAIRARLAPGDRVGLVGGGAGGVELALALRAALDPAVRVCLFAEEILPGAPTGMRRRAQRALDRAGVERPEEFRVVAAGSGRVSAADGREARADYLFWVTQVTAPAWPAAAGLATDAKGFILVDRQLRSVSHPEIFAAGDIAALRDQPRPKAGVFAVRAGPVLAANLRRTLMAQPLRTFRAQRRYLTILGTADGRAIASRGPITVEGRWVWRWKILIDQRFMARFTRLADRTPALRQGDWK